MGLNASLIAAFGVVMTVMCIAGFLAPRRLFGWVNGVWDTHWGMPFAIGVRLVLGGVLVAYAPHSRFPATFLVLGVVALLAAVMLPVIGKERISRVLAAFERIPVMVIRAWLLLGAAFGLFLVWGAVT